MQKPIKEGTREMGLERENAVTTVAMHEPSRVAFRRHQLHFWIGEREYQFLCSLAQFEEESLSNLLRKLIRQSMLQKRELQRDVNRPGRF
jgi:hypothetical protein